MMTSKDERPETITVTPDVAREVVEELARKAPEPWRLMPIGGTLMGLTGLGDAQTTKDIDIVLVTLQGEQATVPTYDEVLAFARDLSNFIQGRKDHTAIELILATDSGPVKVELVRGRATGMGGYFVSRAVLEAAAELADHRPGYLELPPEALAFLKAWAAHDKHKLVDAGKDGRGYHAARRDAFQADVKDLLDDLLDRGQRPDPSVFESLFAATGGEREEAVRKLLETAGWIS